MSDTPSCSFWPLAVENQAHSVEIRARSQCPNLVQKVREVAHILGVDITCYQMIPKLAFPLTVSLDYSKSNPQSGLLTVVIHSVQANEGAAMTSARKNILVVDDEFSIAQTLTWVLEEAGYAARFALSGKAALDLADGNTLDLAVIDVTLPDLDGIKTAVELCKRIPKCKVLLMSGDTESAPLLEAAKKDGINFDVLAKPIPPAELLPKLESLLSVKKARARER